MYGNLADHIIVFFILILSFIGWKLFCSFVKNKIIIILSAVILSAECFSKLTYTSSTFAAPYRQDRLLKEWVRKAMATGHLPVALLRHNFRAFVVRRQTRRLRRRYPTLGDFIQYMEDVYVGEQALFPPPQWCVYGRRSDNRCNNWVEGKNSDLLLLLLLLSHSKSISCNITE